MHSNCTSSLRRDLRFRHAPSACTLAPCRSARAGYRRSSSLTRNRLMRRQSATAPSRAPAGTPRRRGAGWFASCSSSQCPASSPAERGHEEDEPDLREEGEVCERLPVTVHGAPAAGRQEYSSRRGRLEATRGALTPGPDRPARDRRAPGRPSRATGLVRGSSSSGYELASRAPSPPARRVTQVAARRPKPDDDAHERVERAGPRSGARLRDGQERADARR